MNFNSKLSLSRCRSGGRFKRAFNKWENEMNGMRRLMVDAAPVPCHRSLNLIYMLKNIIIKYFRTVGFDMFSHLFDCIICFCVEPTLAVRHKRTKWHDLVWMQEGKKSTHITYFCNRLLPLCIHFNDDFLFIFLLLELAILLESIKEMCVNVNMVAATGK